ncbi:MAG TPA: radical SAM protein [Methylomirabilota bacterium]|nr:radical SAM protein [Methylomirabilota bacterium]
MSEKLLKEVSSICPECHAVIPAKLSQEAGMVLMHKSCPHHGDFQDLYWSDFDQWERARKYAVLGDGLENPRTQTVKGCPYDCGICKNHKSQTILSIIDVTNRCNLRCPICFANAASAGYEYELNLDTIKGIIDNLSENKPVSVKALQLSGGEPTLRNDLPDIVEYAHARGIHHVEVNTNGVRIANDMPFLKRLKDADVSSFYLQFDGVTPDPYLVTRGVDLLPTKLKAIENLKSLGHDSAILVVTLVKGVNDDQLGRIINFAARNHDVIRCVNVQPVSITGRIDRNKLAEYRITIPDFMRLVEEQTNGQILQSDFLPVPFVVPFARAVGALKGTRYPEFTMHEHCGMATFIFVEDGRITPITRYADVEAFMSSMNDVAELAKAGHTIRAKFKMVQSLKHLNLKVVRPLVSGVIREGTYDALGQLMRKVIMIGAMHFMDPYNFDLERVQRCGIHYGLPDGRIIPFCTMNSIHREEIERKLAKPISA